MAALALALALTVPDPAAAEVAAAVPDGATLVLADGTAVRLSGIEPGPGAAAALRGLALGREVALEADGAARDRYGRRVAQVRRADGLWLQAALVERGLARVRGAADHRGALRPLLAVEAAARAARRGGWAGEGWAVLPAGPAVGP
ncbi:MAG TPA: thermonuclease family protein, partial [Alphaproteobacteria bacterium]|nr:thermonuclease family protein [Alphaproteobacteria bacterium]